MSGLGRDLELCLDQLLVVAIARAKHHAVLTERYRLPVTIGRDVTDGEDRHCASGYIGLAESKTLRDGAQY